MDLGEMADNARAALNHLAFQLVIHNGQDPNKGRVQFPIFEVEKDYLGNGGMKSNREKMLAGISAKDRKVIDAAQPYHLGSDAADHPLSILRALTDRHRHREEHVGAMALERFTQMTTVASDWIDAIGITIGNIKDPEPLLDKQVLHTARPTAQTETKLPDDAPAPWTGLTVQVPSATGVLPDNDIELTVAFFGDRAFKIDEIATVLPYVRDLIARFERRVEGKRTDSRPSR